MRLPRPYIPLAVRVQIAERQFFVKCGRDQAPFLLQPNETNSLHLRRLLFFLFADEPYHLDHDPALENRFLSWRDGKAHYVPDANDPEFLIYRTKQNHKIKTYIRGDGAQLSDAAKARKRKRKERKARKRRPSFSTNKTGPFRKKLDGTIERR